MKTLFKTVFYFLLLMQICYPQTDFWQQQGSPYGKYIKCIAAGSAGYVFISVIDGTFLISSNKGDSWLMTDYDHSLIQALAVDNTGRIYGGTKEDGVFRSSDNGTSWQLVSNGLTNSNVLSLTATIYGTFCGTNDGGVYKLINDTSWMYLGLANVPILSLLVNPNGFIYAGTSRYSVFRSTNGGADWTILVSGIGDNRIVNALEFDSNGTLYAGTDRGIYRSTNEGEMWYQSNNGLLDTVVYSLAVSQSQLILASAGEFMYVSSNSGVSWEPHHFFGAEAKCYALSAEGYIYTGTALGMFRSEGSISSWTRINTGLTNGETIKSICFNNNDYLFTGLSTGVYRSDDKGITWKHTALRDINTMALHSTKPDGFILAGTEYWITRSTDNGENWSNGSGYYSAYNVCFGIDGSGNLFSGTSEPGSWFPFGEVLFSTNSGESWNQTSWRGFPVNALSVNASGSLIVAEYYGIYLSTDQGNIWEYVGLDGVNASSVLLTNSGCMFAGTGDGILYRSCNNGTSWEDVSDPLFTAINCMVINNSGSIYLADSNGVFLSTDNGDNWSVINSGLIDRSIISLKIDNGGFLYAGSANGFIYKSNQIVSDILESPNELPQSYYLYQNYPNPFNPSTSIRFVIPKETNVQLKVFDVLGCEISTLIDDRIEAGEYTINFQPVSLSSGVYIYQLKAGTYLDSKKMLLIR